MEIVSRLYGELERAVSECSSDMLALSGGLDSSIIAHLVGGRADSVAVIAEDFVAPDLTYCQLASERLGTELRIERVGTDRLLDAIDETIGILGNFNDIEVRNSVVMYVAADHVRGRGRSGMITGDGADELFAGYDFFLRRSPGELESEQERIWDVMHFPSHAIGRSLGVRVESPFLSDGMRELARSVPVEYKVREQGGTTYGKWILRKAFEGRIPDSITWRRKTAMQDGAGTSGLTGLFDAVVSDGAFESERREIAESDGITVRTKESLHYYRIYRRRFGVPEKSGSEASCPYCGSAVGERSRFCRMCGAYPV